MNIERCREEQMPMKFNSEEIRIPHGEIYKKEIDTAVRRRTVQEITQENLSLRRSYDVGGKRFLVRSVFNTTEKKTPTDMIRRLIDLDCENVS